MIRTILEELEKCLQQIGNPILDYLNSGLPLLDKGFIYELNKMNLEPTEELLDLYRWRPFLSKKYIDNQNFEYNLFDMGSIIDSAQLIEKSWILNGQNPNIFRNKYVPIVLNPILSYEDPIVMDLRTESSTYGGIFIYSPSICLSDKPIQIYDSLELMILTIVECYKNGAYYITSEGMLEDNSEAITNIAQLLNKKSTFWNY